MQHTAELPIHFEAPSEGHPKENQDGEFSLARGAAVLMITSSSSEAGVIQDIGPRALSILVKDALPEGSAVTVEFGALIREGLVISCRPMGAKYEICVAIPRQAKGDVRTAERFPLTQEVRICRAASGSQVDAIVIDLSTNGIGVEMSTPLECGELITVESVSGVAFGTVRHCRRLPGSRFRAGVKVFHVMPKEEAAPARESVLSTIRRLFSHK